MTIQVIESTKDFVQGITIPKGAVITRASDYGTDMYSGVFNNSGVLVYQKDCAIVLEDLHA